MAKYYLCNICGNLVEMIDDAGPTPTCCNQPMREQKPGTTDGSHEKHVPVMEFTALDQNLMKVCVKVGKEPHPTEPQHYIEWIALETSRGMHRIDLTSDCKPQAIFYLEAKEKVINAYAYCNLHGLWVNKF